MTRQFRVATTHLNTAEAMAKFDFLHNGRVKKFRNRQPRCPHCGKRRKGRPAVGYGTCWGWSQSPVRRLRRAHKLQIRHLVKKLRESVDVAEDFSLSDIPLD